MVDGLVGGVWDVTYSKVVRALQERREMGAGVFDYFDKLSTGPLRAG